MASLLLDWALQPLGAVALSLVAALVLLALSGALRGPGGLLALAATLGLWLAASPTPANALLSRIEVSRTGPDACAGEASLPVVVPGGGMDAWRRSDDAYELLHRDSLQRVERAADLAAPDARFHLLGGGDNGRTLADLMAEVLRDRGVPEHRIVREGRSRSTRENARELAALLPPSEHPTIRLVTSALHLARATRVFERVGYRVCGTGVGSIAAPAAGVVGWLPWLSALERSTRAWRELLATLADRRRAAREDRGP